MIIDKTLEFELQIGVLLFNVVANVQYTEEQQYIEGEPIEYNTTLDWVDVESCELLVNGIDLIDGEFITEILDADKVTIADKTLTWYIEGHIEQELGV